MSVYFKSIIPFDATEAYDFAFTYSGGNQAYKNKLVIKDETTLTVIYNKTIQTLQLLHTVPVNTLVNGKKYTAQVSIYDVNDELCATSSAISFKCLKTPTLSFSNIPTGGLIQSSVYSFTMSYSQENGEQLQSYEVSLYTKTDKTVLYTTGVLYKSDDLTATINNFEDNTQYYIKAHGITISGVEVSTGYVELTIDYITPSAFFLVELENKPDIGAISIKSNIISINGTSKNDVTYVNKSYVDLTDGNEIIYSEGFDIPSTSTVIGSVYNPIRNNTILTFANGSSKMKLVYKQGAFESTNGVESAYVELSSDNKYANYVVRSNYISIPSENEVINYCILRKDNCYDIKILNMGGVSV